MTAYVALQTVQQPPLRQPAAEPAAAAAATAADGSLGGALYGLHHVLDMGCGIGSVLLMVAWGLTRMAAEQQQHQQHQQLHKQQQQQQAVFPISSLGVEAQAVSYGLAVRSVRYNLGDAAGQEVQVRGKRGAGGGGVHRLMHGREKGGQGRGRTRVGCWTGGRMCKLWGAEGQQLHGMGRIVEAGQTTTAAHHDSR